MKPSIPAPGPKNRRIPGICRVSRIITLSYLVFFGFGSPAGLFPAEERTIAIGGENGWKAAERRSGITEMNAVRPWPVLVLDSAPQTGGGNGGLPDLALSFDEAAPERYSAGDRYSVSANPGDGEAVVSAAGPEWARMGAGAAFFSGHTAPRPGEGNLPAGDARPETRYGSAGPLLVTPRDPEALFAPGAQVRDFSLEFWLYPLNMENGEQILVWTASRSRGPGTYSFQRVGCSVVKNRLQWNFSDFFIAPGGQESLNLSLNGEKPIVPKSWTHHLIRFDADTGLLEYLVDGRVEALDYATRGGTEGGDVYTPVIGDGGEFILGRLYTGLMDEFRVHSRYAGQRGREFGVEGGIQKYSPAGGRVETRTLDLGEAGRVLRLETLGGRITALGNRSRNDYAGPGELRFADESALQFFMRFGDNPYRWTGDWQVIRPWTELPADIQGRYAQVAAVFYPSADGETSPYLEELRVVYQPAQAPRPPARLSAVARDGAVELSWRQSTDAGVDGYLVYYGAGPGEYLGADALQGPSPVDAGKRGTLRVEGLKNGTLYHFAVAAYQYTGRDGGPGTGFLAGDFSQEVTARPLLEYTLGRYE